MARQNLTKLSLILAAAALAGPALADPLIVEDNALDSERLIPGLYPAAPVPEAFAVPAEPGHPPFEIDWSVGLKGSYTSATTGESFVTTLTPRLSAVHQGVRTDLTFTGSADLTRESDGALGLTGLDLDLESTTRLDRDTTLTGTANLALSRDLRTTPGLDPLILEPPLETSGSLGGAIEKQFGRFNLGLGATLARTVYGPTTRSDTGVTDNSSQNLWEGDARLRLGLQATPIIEVFGEATAGRDWFDRAPAGGVKADATAYALRTGLAGNWNGLVSASASIGIGQHDFDNGAIADVTTTLYDASVTFTPDPTLNVTGSLSTSVEPTGADSGGTVRVAHRAAADLAYTVNSWLRLRASADWSQSWLEGSSESERRHGLGLGADYTLSAHSTVSADYGYAHRDNSASGVVDSHTVSLGVTLRR